MGDSELEVGELSYLSPPDPPRQPQGLAASVVLLAIGTLEVLGAAIVGSALIAVGMRPTSVARFSHASPSFIYRVMVLAAIVYVVLPLAAGITEIVCAIMIWRGSRAATITAIAVVSAQLAGIILFVWRIFLVSHMSLSEKGALVALVLLVLLFAFLLIGLVLLVLGLRRMNAARMVGIH